MTALRSAKGSPSEPPGNPVVLRGDPVLRVLLRSMLLPLLLCSASFGQVNPISVASLEPVALKRGGTASVAVKVKLQAGYHCNTNTPADPYLIPLKLSFAPLGGIESTGIVYPKGKDEKYEFSEKPMNVYSGQFEIKADFKAAPDAPKGLGKIVGKLRFQACNDRMCFAPKTLEVTVPVQVSE